MDECDSGETKTTHLWGFFIYRNRMKILKKDCLGKRQPSLKPVNLAGYRRRTAIWFKKVPRSRRYHVTSKGHRVMGALIEIRHKEYPILAAKKA